MAKSVSTRLAPVKSARAYKALVAENYRDKIPNYVDQEKTGLNRSSARPPSVDELLEQQKTETGRTVRKDARLAYAGIITFSTEAQDDIRDLNRKDQGELYKRITSRICEETRAEGLYLTIHNDETAPHAHFMLKPYDIDGKALRLNPKDMSRLQDAIGEECEKFGLDIHRGKPKAQRIADGEPTDKWVHKTVKELHNELPADIEAKREELEKLQEKANKYNRLAEINQQKIEAGNGNLEKMEKNMALYERRAKEAQDEYDNIKKNTEKLKETMIKIDKELPEVDASPKMSHVTITTQTGLLSKKTETKRVIHEEDAVPFLRDLHSQYTEREHILKDRLAHNEYDQMMNGSWYDKYLELKASSRQNEEGLNRENWQLKEKLSAYEKPKRGDILDKVNSPHTAIPVIQDGKSVSTETRKPSTGILR